MTSHVTGRAAQAGRALVVLAALTLPAACGGRWSSSTTTAATTTSPAAATTSAAAAPPTTSPTPTPSTTTSAPPPSTVATTLAPSSTAPATTAPRSTTPPTSGATPAPAGDDTAQITAAWERFFAGATPLEDRLALLERGESMRPALTALSANTLMAKAGARVDEVHVDGDRADVTYDVLIDGSPMLIGSKGVAVREASTWKVSVETFCSLAVLAGGGPVPGCS